MQTIEEIMKIIGANIRAARLKKGLSQAQLAKLAGLHISTISDLELAKRKDTVLATLDKIVKVLGINLAQLFYQKP